MREILFRGMAINGKWVYGNLSILKKDLHLCGGMVKAGCYISNVAGSPFAYSVRPETVGQYTGLKDKNGVNIFEGDVVQFDTIRRKGVKEAVKFEYGAFMPFWDTCYIDDEQGEWLKEETIEIIGNIHENPELMEAVN